MTGLQAAAGGSGGRWYLLVAGLAALVAEVHPEVRVEVIAGGGVANHERVGRGEIPMAILTVNRLHCGVEQAAPLDPVAAWMQQRHPLRLPVDRVGTVDRLVFRHLLAHFGLTEPDLEAAGWALIPALNYDEQLALYARGEVNALWQLMGIPSPSTRAAQARRPLRLRPFPATFVAMLETLGWTAATLPAGACGPDATVPTVAMTTTVEFHVDAPDDLLYAITEAICEHAARVRRIHPAAARFAVERAHLDGHAPLHPGAARYFRDRGLRLL